MIHYNEKYFEWQKNSGEFGAIVSLSVFSPFILKTDKVIDFGCGGGYLLSKIDALEKIGIEINDSARSQANKNGVKTVKSTTEISDNWADVIISNHALEHCFRPLDELILLYNKLKPNGHIIFMLPFEVKNKYNVGDINQHLYTWSPQNIGNLFTTAGFEVLQVNIIKHRWPPYAAYIYKLFGKQIFNLLCKIYSRIKGDLFQVKIIAIKVIAQ